MKEQLFNDNVGLAYKLSNRYKPSGHRTRDDIDQVALIALWNATDNFDPEKGKFSTFAYKTIYYKLISYFKPLRPKFDDIMKKVDKEYEMCYNINESVIMNRLYTKIDNMSEQRKDVLKHKLNGYSNVDISKMYNCSFQNIAYLYKQTIEDLK